MTAAAPPVEDLDRMIENLTDDRDPCVAVDLGKPCGMEAVAALASECGNFDPVCVLHRDRWVEWLRKHGADRMTCRGWKGRTDEHWHVVPLR